MRPEPISTHPDGPEMAARIARVRQAMALQRLDGYVVASPDNVFYLTNFANFVHERPFVLVVTRDGPLAFVVPRLEAQHVRVRAVGEVELATYAEFPAPAGETWEDRLRALLAPLRRIGVESVCPLMVYETVPGARVCTDLIEDARDLKSPYELGRITYACDLISATHQRLLASAAPGRTLMQWAGEAQAAMLPCILRDNPATNMLATRITAAFQPPGVSHDPHNFTNISMTMARGGPHVSLMNCVINGYGAEVERTFFLGRVPPKAKKPFEVMLEARRLALELTVPGNVMGDVDRHVTWLFRRAGYGDCLLHRTGHGIGVTGHEAPFLADGEEDLIEPGMCFTIEPGIYLPGIGGFRHSDTVITTAEGNMVLTAGPVELEPLTIPIAG